MVALPLLRLTVGPKALPSTANCTVLPVQKPMPPIWIGANADVAIRRAARLGDCWYINPPSTLTTQAADGDYAGVQK